MSSTLDWPARAAELRTLIDSGADQATIDRAIDDTQRQIHAEGEQVFAGGLETMGERIGAAWMFDTALRRLALYGARELGGVEVAAHLRAWAARIEHTPKRAG
jgi:hypothetical protein